MFRDSRDPSDPSRLSVARLFAEGRDAYNPLSPLKTLPNMALYHAAVTLGLRGPYLALGSSAAAGMAALQGALDSLVDGRAEAALAGGADALVELYRLHYLEEAGVLSGAAPGEAGAAIILGPDEPGSVMLAAVGLGQEPAAGPDPARHYSQIDDGGRTRAGLYGATLRAAVTAGAPLPDLVVADLWGQPARDASERAAVTEALGLVGAEAKILSTRERMGQLGAAHGLTDVALAAALIERGEATCALVTASGPAGDLGAAVLWGPS
jgi:3-oxoacyl-(acyl-carrier-protein) synthase